jgi:hypothetical protein
MTDWAVADRPYSRATQLLVCECDGKPNAAQLSLILELDEPAAEWNRPSLKQK